MKNTARVWWIVSSLWALAISAQGAEVFSPSNCEFSVAFPSRYENRELFDNNGQSIVMATTRNGEPLKLSAECWPRQNITPSEYAKKIGRKMSDRGIQVHTVSTRQNSYGEIVTLAGAAGLGKDKYYVRFESHFGPRTRLDLLILEKSAIASDGHLAFRNSVSSK